MLPRPPAALVLGLAALVASPFVTACSGSGGLDASYSVEDALSELPAGSGDKEIVFVQTADLEGATELGDLPDPGEEDWFRSLIEDPIFVTVPRSLQSGPTEEVADTVGFGLEDATSYTSGSLAGGETLEVYRLADGDPPPDSEDLDGLARASDGDRVALASDEDRLADWEEREDTLADDEDLGPLAEAFDDRDVYAAILSTEPEDDGPVRAHAVGQAVDDGEAVEYAAFVVSDGEDTDEVAEKIEAAWNDTSAAESGRLDVEEVDTEGDRIVVVTLRPDEAGETARTLLGFADFDFPG